MRAVLALLAWLGDAHFPGDAVVNRLADAPSFAHLEHFGSWHRTNVNRTYPQSEGQK